MSSRPFLRVVLTLLLIAAICLQTGCWSSNEINNLAIITALGIDREESGEYRITALVVRPGALFQSGSTGGAGGKQESPSLIVSGKGDSLFGAMRNLSTVLAKRMYWAHLQVIVFGTGAAQQNFAQSLDILARQHEFRKNINLLVTRGTAEEIIKVQPQLEGTLGAEIAEIINYSRLTSTTMVSDVSQVVSALSSETRDPVTASISTTAKEKGVRIRSGVKAASAITLNGAAIFSKGKLAGWLNQAETRGVLWVRGDVKSTILELPCSAAGAENAGNVAVEVTHSSAEKKPRISQEKVTMDVTIEVDAEIGEVACQEFELTPQSIEKMNRALGKQVKKEVETVVAKVKEEWHADVFGFGDAIYRTDPKAWARLSKDYREDVLKDMEVSVKVLVNIWRNGSIHDPIKVDEQVN